jgi:hypothetical protein
MAAAAAVIVWACADFDALTDPTGGLPDVVVAAPSFAADIQPIFTRRCAVGGCHTVASHQGGLVLAAGHAYDSIVGKLARSSAAGLLLVEPSDAANSWLVRRVSPDPVLRNHLPRMPLASAPLTDNQIATIINWIEQGAPDN